MRSVYAGWRDGIWKVGGDVLVDGMSMEQLAENSIRPVIVLNANIQFVKISEGEYILLAK